MTDGRTGFLILGLLAEEPHTGYEIRKITEIRFRFFWSESFGQIYPALKKLEAERLVTSTLSGGRRKRMYAITATGRQELSRWLDKPAAAETARFEAILKFSFAWAMSPEKTREHIEDFRARQTENLGELEAFRQELESIPDPYGNHDIALMTIELGLATYKAWRDWSDRVLATRKAGGGNT